MQGGREVAVKRLALAVIVVLSMVFATATAAGAWEGHDHRSHHHHDHSHGIDKIDHVVVLMQENRSYDSYFGPLHHQGQPDSEREPQRPNPNPLGGPPIHPFLTTTPCTTADLNHGWDGTHNEINGGRMDGFTAQNTDPSDPTGSRTMSHYDRKTLPFYYGVANEFSIADRYFASVPGPTYPNRLYLLTATSVGYVSNVNKVYTQKS